MFNHTSSSFKVTSNYSRDPDVKKVNRRRGMWGGGAQCVHASLPRARAQPPPQPAPTLSGAIASRRPPRPTPPSPTLVAQIDSSVACLWLLTPLSAGTAVAAVLIAVTTNNWLHTQENILNPAFNGTGKHELVAKHTVSGLWRICHTDPGSTEFRCWDIPYFPLSQYAPDASDSTNAIPYVVTRSAAPLLLAVVTQAVGALCCVLGHCVKGRRLCTFIAGVLFIISGLIMLTGIVMYISVFKSQVGHKLRYMAFFDTPRMSYSYGYSFGLYIGGFVAAELAGTSAIFLFLQWYQKDWITELSDKAKSDCRAWDREYAFTDFRERDSTLLERRIMKRDTYPPAGSSAATPNERRRFVYDDMPHCSIHKNRRINLSSASLKDLSSSTLYGFPAAPRPTACDNYFEEFKEVPQSANTLSGLRSASIFQSQASVASGRFLDTSAVEPPPSREEELVTFGAGARAIQTDDKPSRHDRAVGTDPYRRTTPV
ncbi:voltage-dependent calcium channel gamma-7 subunit [Aricia agestis]|uniref:voltage-dependent calcium channel gamma-7 subunit n=1 Tax=Aricia agestis TaxID=91739 RepID=UPI001C204662|nr:voltage-dependent calcium channel gamma-7 subunit [Aricia agestis]